MHAALSHPRASWFALVGFCFCPRLDAPGHCLLVAAMPWQTLRIACCHRAPFPTPLRAAPSTLRHGDRYRVPRTPRVLRGTRRFAPIRCTGSLPFHPRQAPLGRSHAGLPVFTAHTQRRKNFPAYPTPLLSCLTGWTCVWETEQFETDRSRLPSTDNSFRCPHDRETSVLIQIVHETSRPRTGTSAVTSGYFGAEALHALPPTLMLEARQRRHAAGRLSKYLLLSAPGIYELLCSVVQQLSL